MARKQSHNLVGVPGSLSIVTKTQIGWETLESPNFRAHHVDRASWAEQALEEAEQTRRAVLSHWFGEDNPKDWDKRCDIYIYPNQEAEAYRKATGIGGDLWTIGQAKHSQNAIHIKNHGFWLDLGAGSHEVTHIILRRTLGDGYLPLWADEGIACQSQNAYELRYFSKRLQEYFQKGIAFPSQLVMGLRGYPEGEANGMFYAQSHSLVKFLEQLRGPREFMRFLQTVNHRGSMVALHQHYGISFQTLDYYWRADVLKK